MSRKRSKSNKIGCLFILVCLVVGGIFGGILLVKNPYQTSSLNRLNRLKNQIQNFLPSKELVGISKPTPTPKVAYKFAILSDTHEDETYFPKIVDQIQKRQDIVFVAHLGDLSNAGDKLKLQEAKNILDHISEPVFVIPGDHDLNWLPQHDLANFMQVFHEQKTYYTTNRANEHFIFLDNSNINSGLSDAEWQWLEADLQSNRQPNIYVFMSTPLSNPYLSFKKMGAENEGVAAQAEKLSKLFGQYHVKAIFAGDTHTFSKYDDTISGVPTITVGSAGSTKNPLPLYLTVDILENGGYNVTSIPYTSAIPVQGSD
jgi:hypothetical protein